MSFLELANFFKTQASDNEGLSLALENLEKYIKKYTQLKAQELAVHDEKFHLQMEARSLELFADHMEEHREHQTNITKEISELYDNFMKLSTPLRNLNMTEVMGYHVLAQQLKWQEEKKEIEETLRHKKEMLEKMENRNVVQNFRRTQKEYKEALDRMQQVEKFKETKLKEIRQKLQDAYAQRNEKIVNMVKDAKILENTRREKIDVYEQYQILKELEKKKLELMTKLQDKQNQQKCTTTKSSISSANTIHHTQVQESCNILEELPTFDPRNPMAFLKSLNLDIDTNKIMEDFSLELQKKELQKEARKDSEDVTELRPILRNKNDANDNVETNHVHFMESESSCGSISSCSSFSTPSSVLDCMKAVNSNLPISPTIESAENVEIINLLTPANEMSEADEISDMIVETPETNNEISTKSGPVAEVLECKIIKPAGTALPKSIPFTLSPPTSISDKKKQVTVAATISENFKIPQPLKQEKFIGTKSKLAEKTKKASRSKQSLENMNTEFNFESFLLSNKSPSSDSDNDLDFKRGTDSNPDDFMLDFDSNDENKNVDNSDNDDLEFNFIDSDVHPNAGRNDFDL